MLFACMTLGYILITIQFEERDLIDLLGHAFAIIASACRC